MDIHHTKRQYKIDVRRRFTFAGLTGILFSSTASASPETIKSSVNLSSNMMGGGMGWGGMFFGPLFLTAFVIVVFAVVLFLMKSSASNTPFNQKRDPQQTPLEILKGRYARGEIDKKEFEEKKRDLDR